MKIALEDHRPLAPDCNLSEYAHSSDVSLHVVVDISSIRGIEKIHELLEALPLAWEAIQPFFFEKLRPFLTSRVAGLRIFHVLVYQYYS